MIYAVGADPFGDSPSSISLNKLLAESGYKLSEVRYADNVADVPSGSHVLAFGSGALAALGVDSPISVARGELVIVLDSCLACLTYSPGYLYRKPELIWQFKEDLVTFRVFIHDDQGKVLD